MRLDHRRELRTKSSRLFQNFNILHPRVYTVSAFSERPQYQTGGFMLGLDLEQRHKPTIGVFRRPVDRCGDKLAVTVPQYARAVDDFIGSYQWDPQPVLFRVESTSR